MSEIATRPTERTLPGDGNQPLRAQQTFGKRIRVAVVGATGYAGGELIRLLARHPHVEVVGLVARDRHDEALEGSHPHLGRTGLRIDEQIPDADAVFLALPHGAAATIVPGLARGGATVIDLGPDYRLKSPDDYPRWYGFEHPDPELLATAVYGLPELNRSAIAALAEQEVRIVGSPGCYPTATLLALAPLARAGLIDDLVVDAKSGVSGAGREPRAEFGYSEVNESVRAYGVGGHRHVAEIEQELEVLEAGERSAGGARRTVDFLPHLVPMTRGILVAAHVRPTRPVAQAELDDLYVDAYAGERFVRVAATAPSTKQVLGSNDCVVHVHSDPRTGRVLALAVIDNLVKGAAGQAIQSFNIVHGLAEEAGLEQLPLAP